MSWLDADFSWRDPAPRADGSDREASVADAMRLALEFVGYQAAAPSERDIPAPDARWLAEWERAL